MGTGKITEKRTEEQRRAEALALLKHILDIPSVNGKDREQETAVYLAEYLKRKGMETRVQLIDEHHGNVIGVGTASFITKKAVDKIDFDAMYTNCIASTDPHAGRISIVLTDAETALRAAIFNCPRIDHSQAKVVWIKDTLHLIDIKVSESLLKICEADPARFTVL